MSYTIYIDVEDMHTTNIGSLSTSPTRSPNSRSLLSPNNDSSKNGAKNVLKFSSTPSYDNVISILDTLIRKEKDNNTFDTIKHCKHCKFKFRKEYSQFTDFCSKECKCCYEWFLKKDDQQQEQQLQLKQLQLQQLQQFKLNEQAIQTELDETTSEDLTDDDDESNTWHTCPGYAKTK